MRVLRPYYKWKAYRHRIKAKETGNPMKSAYHNYMFWVYYNKTEGIAWTQKKINSYLSN